MILAIDPGKNVGIAELNNQGELLAHYILSLEELVAYPIALESLVLLGDGTGSEPIAKILEKRKLNFTLVDESATSLEARKLYFQYNPPKGLARLIPESFRSPPELIDDYAAYAIALKYLREARNEASLKEKGKHEL